MLLYADNLLLYLHKITAKMFSIIFNNLFSGFGAAFYKRCLVLRIGIRLSGDMSLNLPETTRTHNIHICKLSE